MKWLLTILVLCASAFGQSPVLFYSDLITGMCGHTTSPVTGESDRGHWVTITGNFLGASGSNPPSAAYYVKLTPAGGGASTTLDTYKFWALADPSGYQRIAFQLGTASTCVSDGDYNISVVTPSGTSNTLPIHIYSGSNIYFVGSGGSDSYNGKYPTFTSGSNGPFATLSNCIAQTKAAAGNTCYIMPGFASKTLIDDNGWVSAFPVVIQNGTSSKYISYIGYPTSNLSQIPKIGCYDGISCTQAAFISVFALTSYVTVANVHYYVGGPANDGKDTGIYLSYPGRFAHHARFINNEVEAPVGMWGMTAVVTNGGTYIPIYGLYAHDWGSSDPTTNKHSNMVYIGEGSHDVDVGWSTFDLSCSYRAATPCHPYKVFEIHATAQGEVFPAPTLGTPTATTGGSLTPGTYDIKVSYRSHVYYAGTPFTYTSWNVARETESPISTLKTVVVGGGNNAINIPAPAGYDYDPLQTDGVTMLCNPALAYKVYACLEGVNCTSGPLYQGESVYTNSGNRGTPPSAAAFTLNSLDAGGSAYVTPVSLTSTTDPSPGHYETDASGCNIYNVALHDSQFKTSTSYALALDNQYAGDKGYIRIYNNVFSNNGSYGAAIQDTDPGGDPDYPSQCISAPVDDFNGKDLQVVANVDLVNNTFYNCGAGPWDSPSIIGLQWYSGMPLRTYTFTNNVFYKFPLALHSASTVGSQVSSTGSNNFCYGAGGIGCPNGSAPKTNANWNASGAGPSPQDPKFTLDGTATLDPNRPGATPDYSATACAFGGKTFLCGTGGTIYTGFNLMPKSDSPLRGAGTTPPFTITYDIYGTPRTNPPDIGAIQYGVTASPSINISGAIITGVVIR